MLTAQELRIHFVEKNAIMHICELEKEFCWMGNNWLHGIPALEENDLEKQS